MINILERAVLFATQKHLGQTDKIGEPYILHPLRVMMCVPTVNHRVVAVLHDVIEDTKTTETELRVTFGELITNAVLAISKKHGEVYSDYLKRVKQNELARTVKIMDIKDNASPIRLYKLDPDTILRLTKKYSYALQFLEK